MVRLAAASIRRSQDIFTLIKSVSLHCVEYTNDIPAQKFRLPFYSRAGFEIFPFTETSMNRRRGGMLIHLALIALVLTGCASLTVVDSAPLPQSKLEPVGSQSISSDGYRLSALSAPEKLQDVLIMVAFSGGGKRSAAFSYGALQGMRNLYLPAPEGKHRLLDELSGITGVSGGSFTAAYYGLYRERTFGQYEKDFLYSDTNSYIWGIYLLPWHWTWIVDPVVGTNDFMEHVYDRTMFHGATFKDLIARGPPAIAISATDLNFGSPFIFTQEVFDVICSDLSQFPISRAVAASNGFPGLFSPVTITNHTADCGGREPAWLTRVSEQERLDPMSRLGQQARNMERYLDPKRTRYLHLADGGISDNLGLRVAGNMMYNLAQSPNAISAAGYNRFRRVLILSIGAMAETG